MPASNSPSPLPCPAQEIRSSALDALTNFSADLGRLILFFRGHQKDTTALESIQLRIMSIEMTIHHLAWGHTKAEPDFDTPVAPPIVKSDSPILPPEPTSPA